MRSLSTGCNNAVGYDVYSRGCLVVGYERLVELSHCAMSGMSGMLLGTYPPARKPPDRFYSMKSPICAFSKESICQI